MINEKNKIELKTISKKGGKVEFVFLVTDGLTQFFSDQPFWIEYSESIEDVPDSILAVPFVCNVLPIVWLTDSELWVPQLDETFYNCIPEVKKGYEKMYPETEWKGKIEVGKIVPCGRIAEPGKCAMFYSAGVDSVQTLISHIGEKPMLISIWGSDVRVENTEGWKILNKAIFEAAEHFCLQTTIIKSMFREFDNEGALDGDYYAQLGDGWWHGVKHGLALLGHVAPLAYLYGLEKMYIAASNCPEDSNLKCASNPLIDNCVRYANCCVFHDGFEFSRQKKVRNIVAYASNHKLPKIHVCWETQSGENCCKCEKCFRTIAGILAENGDPAPFGFSKYADKIPLMEYVVCQPKNRGTYRTHWKKIQRAVIENKAVLKKQPFWKYIKWIEDKDFTQPETVNVPLMVRVKHAKGLRGKLAEFKFYQMLHNMKESLVKR